MNELLKRLIQECRNRPEKCLQYLMLIMLFGLAAVLPVYAVRMQAVESAARKIRETYGNEDNSSIEIQNGLKESERGKETIVLDAGHGGFDNGMVGSSGISEKELNLIYAKKLEKLLTEAGYRVVQTRNTEEGLYDADQNNKKAQDMQRRCEIIEKEKPLLTISIHQNSYPQDSSVCGPQVFYYEQSQEGEKLAEAIQKQLNSMPDVMRSRKQKGNSDYYILKKSDGVTVIVECGFLTNPKEEQMLQEETYQDQVVKAVYNGAIEYLELLNGNV